MDHGITWYDVLGVLPGAELRKIRRGYGEKSALLAPAMIAGAPSNVLRAVTRAQERLDTAWRTLSDPQARAGYDETAGLRRTGGGLSQAGSGLIEPRPLPGDMNAFVEEAGGGALAGLAELIGGRVRKPAARSRAAVPDFSGLFYGVCRDVARRHGLQVTSVRLTPHPMPVEGLVVGQDPAPGTMRRGGQLTVQVWHPPAR
jgi:hypothetical protein